MKFLIDENVVSAVVSVLRKEGHDVKDIKEEKLYGLKDGELFRMAIAENRIIITHDKDFTTIFTKTKKKHPGIILLRFQRIKPSLVTNILMSFLHSNLKEKINENLIILTEYKIVVQTPLGSKD